MVDSQEDSRSSVVLQQGSLQNQVKIMIGGTCRTFRVRSDPIAEAAATAQIMLEGLLCARRGVG